MATKQKAPQMRLARLESGEIFLETPDSIWVESLDAWRAQLARIHQSFRHPERVAPLNPAPSPQGHVMFGTARRPARRIESVTRLWCNGFACLPIGHQVYLDGPTVERAGYYFVESRIVSHDRDVIVLRPSGAGRSIEIPLADYLQEIA